ncbi:COX15/CtaA family protein [Zooshikella marina]|uniref:COX15/CtaA family protein n=1 Tax=Zooshikella ganghwensis TaxID=202772 RepID=UPI001BB03915|nr:COX15/CtaA family protein [Zooshikella ganghwensis]MBU2708251.1 COX15/CtaA family protein [Zooshikella ganghwensis]
MPNKPGYYCALIATLLAGIVVVLGAYTRLVDAGLGCPDWPGCYGFLTVPTSEDEINIAELRYPETPVETHKGWPEMVHRYFAGSLGILILFLAAHCYRNRHQENQPVKLPIAILMLVILQAAFGMWTVTLKLWPQVVLAHLIGGFATFSLLFLLTLRLKRKSTIFPKDKVTHPSRSGTDSNITHRSNSNKNLTDTLIKAKVLGISALFILSGQIMLGGWTSSNYAALACIDLPTCHNTYWPEMDFSAGFNVFQEIGPNYLGGQLDSSARTAIHFAHRVGAIITTFYLLFLILWIKQKLLPLLTYQRKNVANALLLLLSALCIQVSLGISNVIWLLPLSVAVAHNAGGALLLLSCIFVCYHLFKINNNQHNTINLHEMSNSTGEFVK